MKLTDKDRKTIDTGLAGMITVTGLLLAGSETTNLMIQFLTCLAGVVMFAGGMSWIAKIHRR